MFAKLIGLVILRVSFTVKSCLEISPMMFKNTIKNFSTHDPNHKVIEVVLKVSWKLVESFGTKSKVF